MKATVERTGGETFQTRVAIENDAAKLIVSTETVFGDN
jgi:hypothetical protein